MFLSFFPSSSPSFFFSFLLLFSVSFLLSSHSYLYSLSHFFHLLVHTSIPCLTSSIFSFFHQFPVSSTLIFTHHLFALIVLVLCLNAPPHSTQSSHPYSVQHDTLHVVSVVCCRILLHFIFFTFAVSNSVIISQSKFSLTQLKSINFYYSNQ